MDGQISHMRNCGGCTNNLSSGRDAVSRASDIFTRVLSLSRGSLGPLPRLCLSTLVYHPSHEKGCSDYPGDYRQNDPQRELSVYTVLF